MRHLDAVLRWTGAPAGRPLDPEADATLGDGLDVDTLLAAVDAHALAGRLAARLAQRPAAAVPRELRDGLHGLVRRDNQLAARQRAAIGELRSRLPDHPAAAALVLCAHAFLNLTNLWSISHRDKPYVRLCELADIRALVGSPRFDRHRFDALVEQHRGQDCVRWASWASRTLIGTDPSPGYPTAGSGDRFPRCLWWDVWVDVPGLTPDLLRPDWYDLTALTSALGRPATPVGPAATRLGLADAGGRHVLSDHPDLVPADWAVWLRTHGDTVEVRVDAGADPVSGASRIRVDFGRPAVEWRIDAGGDITSIGAALPAAAEASDGMRRVTFQVPRGALRSPDGRVPVLVGVASHPAGGGAPAVTAVLAAELRLDPGGAS